MKRRMTNNPFGSRKMPAAAVPPVPFEIPAAERDETAPNGRIIRRAAPKRPFTAQDAIDVIRKLAIEARS